MTLLIRDSKTRGRRALIFGLVIGFALSPAWIASAAAAQPRAGLPAWPYGFGQPVQVIEGLRYLGYRSVQAEGGDIWCFVAQASGTGKSIDSSTTAAIGLVTLEPDGHVQPFKAIAQSEGQIVDFDVANGDGRAAVVWAEKLGEEYALRLTLATAGGDWTTSPLTMIGSVLTDVAVTVSDGRIYVGWIDQEEGRPAVFLRVLDVDARATGPERVRVTTPLVSAGALRLFPAPGGAALTWVQSQDVMYEMMFSVYRNGRFTGPTLVDETTAKEEYGVVVEYAEQFHLTYTKGRIFRGETGRAAVMYGALDLDGNWLVEPVTVTGGEGNASAPSLTVSDGKPRFVWSDNRQGGLAIFWADPTGVGENGTLAPQSGAVTYSRKECLYPTVFVSESGIKTVLYSVYSKDYGVFVMSTSTANPALPDWRYYLGLDLEHPASDAFFLLVNALGGAGAATMLAFPAIGLGVGAAALGERLGIFSSGRFGAVAKMGLSFSVIFLLKGSVGWLYAFAPVVSGGAAWFSVALSGALSCVAVARMRTDHRGIVASIAGSALFAFFDALFCVIQKGVRWL